MNVDVFLYCLWKWRCLRSFCCHVAILRYLIQTLTKLHHPLSFNIAVANKHLHLHFFQPNTTNNLSYSPRCTPHMCHLIQIFCQLHLLFLRQSLQYFQGLLLWHRGHARPKTIGFAAVTSPKPMERPSTPPTKNAVETLRIDLCWFFRWDIETRDFPYPTQTTLGRPGWWDF